ncbi:hypothetical protein SHANETTE_209 [Bacillus phage Shanette]|uniref:Uncharacterized protein n=2 Tax=Siminovitchvirus TaxID=1918721 RepID=S5M8N2_9CAUD|nr:hypothetical protein AVV47_gp087 [Bacillus phage JL]YP_009216204.1 hypothetical protein AVV46_gp088 [Bacillus phage Shanette]AGR46873.1 hypothetical protein JL_209 [Bacillus phage JL]AGR47099.1 hypothetical protein SHANETTE_209 [Bacillus phage Shanette]
MNSRGVGIAYGRVKQDNKHKDKLIKEQRGRIRALEIQVRRQEDLIIEQARQIKEHNELWRGLDEARK